VYLVGLLVDYVDVRSAQINRERMYRTVLDGVYGT